MKWICPKCGAVVYGGRGMTEAQIKKIHVCEKKVVDLKKEPGEPVKKEQIEPVKKEEPEFQEDLKDKMYRKGFKK